jgi:hypothetical protein
MCLLRNENVLKDFSTTKQTKGCVTRYLPVPHLADVSSLRKSPPPLSKKTKQNKKKKEWGKVVTTYGSSLG